MVYDTIIIGKGPAGISAALYLKRFNKNILVIGKDGGVLETQNVIIDNYYGVGKVFSKEIYNKSIEHAETLGIKIVSKMVISLSQNNNLFEVFTDDTLFKSLTVLIATGVSRQQLAIKGFNKYKNKGISFCATCDGFFYKNQKIALIGYNPYMLHELEHLKNITNSITVFTNGNKLSSNPNVLVVNEKIKEFVGDENFVTGIVTTNNIYAVDGVFVALNTPSALDFANQVGILTKNSNIIVDDQFSTNIQGLFAAGDTTGGILQINKAVYEGMLAANAINNYLNKKVA